MLLTSSRIILSSRAHDARHWVTRSSRPIPFDAIHRRGSIADTPSSASAVMDSRILPVYHREPLSLLSERSLVAQDSPQSRRIPFIYIYITAALSSILPALPISVPLQPLCLLLFFRRTHRRLRRV